MYNKGYWTNKDIYVKGTIKKNLHLTFKKAYRKAYNVLYTFEKGPNRVSPSKAQILPLEDTKKTTACAAWKKCCN